MSASLSHASVMLEEAIDALGIQHDGVYMDLTFGRGGHAQAILARLTERGRLIVMDKDPEALKVAHELFDADDRVVIRQGSYVGMAAVVRELHLEHKINGVLMDLGVSSPQLDDASRGFSFISDGPLDMRMDPALGQSAAEWLHDVSAEELAMVIREYGEERHARRIARTIVEQREIADIVTTHQLVGIVERCVPRSKNNKHPATRTFQAIRIYINNELEDLKQCLGQLADVMACHGRLVVISFHSLEDRIVKRFIRGDQKNQALFRKLPMISTDAAPAFRLVKKVKAGGREVATNVRARSAVMRIAERAA